MRTQCRVRKDLRNDLFPVTVRLELVMEFAAEISVQVGRGDEFVEVRVESHLVRNTVIIIAVRFGE